jgi:hypothetical protein
MDFKIQGLTQKLQRNYLIYVDILGFDRLAEEIASKKGLEARFVRKTFIGVIEKRVQALKDKNKLIGGNYGGSDDWLLVTDSIDHCFYCISQLLCHQTDFDGYEIIPLEIALGTAEYDRWAKLDGSDLVCEEGTIKALKENITEHYRKWHRREHSGKPPVDTFVVLTESTYAELEPLDKKICQEVLLQSDDERKKKVVRFFRADLEKVIQRGRVLTFLEEIEHPGDKHYDRIGEVYVPLLEYEEIRKVLKKYRIVFITGAPEYGKTFTAIRLMWEYYQKGYRPKWVRGIEKRERIDVRRRLGNISAELLPMHSGSGLVFGYAASLLRTAFS